MMNSGHNAVILSAIIIGLVFHAFMYAGQPAIMAEMFPTRMRYSGVSLGYQVTSIVAGSLAPIIATGLLSKFDSSVPHRDLSPAGIPGHYRRSRFRAGDQGNLARVRRCRRRTSARRRAGRCFRMTLSGKTALVTGGASGIGEACARLLAARGAHVTVADLDDVAAKALADEIDGTAWAVDLLDTDQLVDLALETDVLVNNAGIQRVSPIEDFDVEDFRKIQRLMVEAPFLLVRAALPYMYRKGFGRIVNISSVHGLRASAFKSAYVTAKHGLEGLSKVVALEGAPHGVTSNCVNPGYVLTPLVRSQISDQAKVHGISESEVVEKVMLTESAIKRMVEPAEVASLVGGWLASPEASMVTGGLRTPSTAGGAPARSLGGLLCCSSCRVQASGISIPNFSRVMTSGSGPPRTPVSSASIAESSSAVSSKSNTSKFSAIREGVTDLGDHLAACWRCQRSITCAGDLP